MRRWRRLPPITSSRRWRRSRAPSPRKFSARCWTRRALDRAYVNNGGDIALHLTDGEQFTVGLMDRPDRHGADANDDRSMPMIPRAASRPAAATAAVFRSASPTPSPCWRERRRRPMPPPPSSPMPSICPDIPPLSAVRPMNCSPTAISARALSPATSAQLSESEIEDALRAGAGRARQLLAAGLIEGAALRLLGETVVVGATGIEMPGVARRSLAAR